MTELDQYPKPGSSLPVKHIYASYTSTCANQVTCNQPASVTDANGNKTDDSTHGGVLTITQPAQANGVGPDPDGAGPLARRAMQFTYNNSGSLLSAAKGTTPDQSDGAMSSFGMLQQLSTTYDAQGRKGSDAFIGGGNTYNYIQYGYHLNGDLACAATRMNPSAFTSASSACVQGTIGSYGYDRIAKYFYDFGDRPWATLEMSDGSNYRPVSVKAYSANGNLASLTDGNFNTTSYAYDGFDRLSQTTYPSASNGAAGGATETFAYDANDNATSFTGRDGVAHSSSYDALNRQTSLDAGASTYIGTTYDNLGKVLAKATANTYNYVNVCMMGSGDSTRTPTHSVGVRPALISWAAGPA